MKSPAELDHAPGGSYDSGSTCSAQLLGLAPPLHAPPARLYPHDGLPALPEQLACLEASDGCLDHDGRLREPPAPRPLQTAQMWLRTTASAVLLQHSSQMDCLVLHGTVEMKVTMLMSSNLQMEAQLKNARA